MPILPGNTARSECPAARAAARCEAELPPPNNDDALSGELSGAWVDRPERLLPGPSDADDPGWSLAGYAGARARRVFDHV
ncbi:hypothetical protein K0651_08570 [Ornithinimicrobium sp. Arc0846-15]|nr:hypothetical protein [Ornithinimicrobium laminariae]